MPALSDRVRETSTTTGTGTFSLAGAVTGFVSFSSAFGNGVSVYYVAALGAEWEIGIGTTGAGTLTRDTVIASSAGGTTKVTFSAGAKDVFCSIPAVGLVTTDDVASTNTANKVVKRDGSGNFAAGTITATLTGNASTATALQTARTINGVSFNGTANITVAAAAGTLTGNTLASGVTASSLTSVGTLTSLTVSGNLTVDTNTLAVVASTNRVGILNASPSYTLDIGGTTSFTDLAQFTKINSGNAHPFTFGELVGRDPNRSAASAMVRFATASAWFNGAVVFLTSTDITASAPVARWRIQSNGDLLAEADNTHDIGASGASRPRDVYIGRNITVGGAWQGVFVVAAGTASAPALTFSGDTDTGIFGQAANVLGFTTGGVERLRLSGNVATLYGTNSGNAANFVFGEVIGRDPSRPNDSASIRVQSDASWFQGAVVFFTSSDITATAAVERWRVSGGGHFLAGTDNTYDIGASGATRPRDLYLGRNMVGSGWVRAGAASAGAASTTTFGSTTSTTVGATGAASALPANPLGYLVAHVGTTEVRIPYYNA